MKRQYKFSSWWLTGFTQADGSFIIIIRKRIDYKVGYQVKPIFVLTQNISEMDMMISLQKYLGVGSLRVESNDVMLEVTSIKELLNVIIPHFDIFPVKGRKT